MTMTIYENRPAKFWVAVGPYFASRAVRREMPYLQDDEGYVWFVLTEGKRTIGFASCHVDKSGNGHLHGLYVVPEHRENGVAQRLVKERLEWLQARGVKLVKTTVNEKSAPVLASCGFVDKGPSGSYRKMEAQFGPAE